jgi:hypothetical protein
MRRVFVAVVVSCASACAVGSFGASGVGPAPGGGGSNGGGAASAPPDPSGQPCTTPGQETGRPSLQVCRISSPNDGRCEGCTNCGNLGKPCAASADCDILFQCYAGTCKNICPLGSSYCGAVTDCIDVGNSSYGVCR